MVAWQDIIEARDAPKHNVEEVLATPEAMLLCIYIYIHTNPHTSIGNTTPILWSGEPCGHLKQLQRFPRSTFSSDVLELWSF